MNPAKDFVFDFGGKATRGVFDENGVAWFVLADALATLGVTTPIADELMLVPLGEKTRLRMPVAHPDRDYEMMDLLSKNGMALVLELRRWPDSITDLRRLQRAAAEVSDIRQDSKEVAAAVMADYFCNDDVDQACLARLRMLVKQLGGSERKHAAALLDIVASMLDLE
jgi:hypothetical protein